MYLPPQVLKIRHLVGYRIGLGWFLLGLGLVKAFQTFDVSHFVLFRPTSIDELLELRPSLAQSFVDMVRYEEDDFEDIYDLTFSVSKVTTYTIHMAYMGVGDGYVY